MLDRNGAPRTPILEIRDLVVEFSAGKGAVTAVNGVSISLWPGEVLGVVGESGSGKTVTFMAALGLIPQPPGRVVAGEVLYRGNSLLRATSQQLRKVRGGEIGVIFQDPQKSLNPVLTIGHQISESILAHRRVTKLEASRAAVSLLERVGIPSAAERANQYPFQWSGGMRQRAMIAIAIANSPKVLIADEPTTALDVTTQAQVLAVLNKARVESGAATVLITHDLRLIAELADRVVVMYGGRVMEVAPVDAVFDASRHPYTRALLDSMPRLDERGLLRPIPGSPPDLDHMPAGCVFEPRCALARGLCRSSSPELVAVSPDQRTACHFHSELTDKHAPRETRAL